MGLILFAIFVIVPILEIATFIQVGSLIGLLPTLAGILATAVIGALLVRQQGFKVLQEAQSASARNEMPIEPAVHGVFILLAGLLLLTPGFVTDAVGFLLLVPPVRRWIARRGWDVIKTRVNVTTFSNGSERPQRSGPPRGGVVIDGEAVDVTNDPDPRSPWIQNRPKPD